MKRIFKHIFFTCLFVTFGSISVYAAEDLSVKIQTDNNKIYVSWNDLGFKYKLLKIGDDSEELLYEGIDNEFIVAGLDEGRFNY